MLLVDCSSSGLEYSYFLSLTGVLSDHRGAEIIVKFPDLKKIIHFVHFCSYINIFSCSESLVTFENEYVWH